MLFVFVFTSSCLYGSCLIYVICVCLYIQLFVWLMSYLCYLCLFAHSGVFCFVCLRPVYLMLVASFSGLSIFFIVPSEFFIVYLSKLYTDISTKTLFLPIAKIFKCSFRSVVLSSLSTKNTIKCISTNLKIT
jgi:hypothetical protein